MTTVRLYSPTIVFAISALVAVEWQGTGFRVAFLLAAAFALWLSERTKRGS